MIKNKYLVVLKNAFLATLVVFGNIGGASAFTKKPLAARFAPKKVAPKGTAKKASTSAPKAPAKTAPTPAAKTPAPAAPAPKKAPGKVATPAPIPAPKAPAKTGGKAPGKGAAPKAPATKGPAKAAPKAPGKKATSPVKVVKGPGNPQVVAPPPPGRPVPPPLQPVAVGGDQFQRFQKNQMVSALFFTSLKENSWQEPRSNIYRKSPVNFSKAPKLHAYNSSILELLCVQLPQSVLRNLPRGIENENLLVLPQLNFVITTAEELDGDPHNDHLSFRPHYFVHADAPVQENPTYNRGTALQAAIFNGQGQNLGFDDLPLQGRTFVRAEISTHPGGPEGDKDLIASPPNLRIHGAQPGQTNSYFSSFYTEDNPPRAAITYHWVLGRQDAREVSDELDQSPTFRDFHQRMRARWHGRAMMDELDGLLRGLY